MSEWIKVEDRLPDVGMPVLAIAARAFGTSCHYTVYRTETDDWFWRDSHTGAQAGWFTHWMPLPDPPERA